MSILEISIGLPPKYIGCEIEINRNVIDCVTRVINKPFCLTLKKNDGLGINETFVFLGGNTKRIGPVAEGKIKLAVRQGLAITRNQCFPRP